MDQPSELALVADLMQAAGEVMAGFPADFIPPGDAIPESALENDWMSGHGVDDLLADPEVEQWLYAIMDTWPDELVTVFVTAGSTIAEILEAFGGGDGDATLDARRLALFDEEARQLAMALAAIEQQALREAEEQGADADIPKDPLGFGKAAKAELYRRSIAGRVPFARTLTTLLGPDALVWLTARTRHGPGKIQPHEFSRSGWYRLSEIETQTAIEQELLAIDPEAEALARIVVAMAWTLAALASFVTPAVFIEEATSRITSLRDGGYTVSGGTESRMLAAFDSSSMRTVVAVLAEALANPLLSAPDLMWMGAALARIREIEIRNVEPITVDEERFGLFLSHRGRDAKLPLSVAVQNLQPTHGVFLDCLTLPHGVVNRSFIYSSLAHADRVLIVETEHYGESEWCRKEAWFGDALSRHGLASLEHTDLAGAVRRVADKGGSSHRRRAEARLRYPLADRVLHDIDNWQRAPNLHSLTETGYSSDAFEALQRMLASVARPEETGWVEELGATVAETIARVVADAPDASPVDLWITALQYAVAAFGSTSNARSKDEVRRGIDHLTWVVKTFVGAELHRDPVFRARAPEYLALVAAAAAIQLAGFDLDGHMTPALRRALGDVAVLQDGLLMLDAREPGERRAFHLHFVATLIRGNLGSVGIVQDASDEVHQQRVDGISLEVLPCVTLHPGIEPPFATDSAGPPTPRLM